MARLDVAVGVLFNSNNQVLIGQRLVNDDYYQKWEFPGGKIESGESPEQALRRELDEELAIDVEEFEFLIEHLHDYPDRQVRLFVYRINNFKGEPVGREGQALRWVTLEELESLDFLKGNYPIVDQLLLIAT